ncbi:hypothetical protein H8784_03280 [Parabacteroides acidifaciens]|uniref:Uncharacterized protein n=1 Tax=Parabacteroides acidifaciens TaxID=2290935 RepID=A0A3D8HHL6_9BACT|nr:hypothetical protein [Parabacteroides acidifaciens]MBC8600739.1 hypothetical protein [Parabacteroides acidifaciens]RDU50469.1 hypothetical protein DWU89_03320 [Parabacteroides acidifaciens]
MDDFRELYQRIEYLRNNGVKMKEIADCAEMAPSILSSLYTTVLPAYFEGLKNCPQEEALERALVLVNNISKRRLLSILPDLLERLDKLEPAVNDTRKANPFLEHLQEEVQLSIHRVDNICGLYTSYSLSSSSDCLKVEPFIINLSENKEHIRIGRLNAYGEAQWGMGVIGDPQNFYCMFSENPSPQFTLVTVYLQIPFFRNPRQLRGLYIGLDYNRNPVARRILLIKESDSTNTEEFLTMESGLVQKEDFTPEQQAYYDYTCQTGDYIKMCTVPSLQMNETDLIKEKKMLSL